MAKSKIKIIAEVGVNHNGSIKSALRYIKAAKSAGADAVKFQLFSADKLVTRQAKTAKYQESLTGNKNQFDLLKKLELTQNDIISLQREAKIQDIDFICTPFDIDSLKFLMDQKISAIKLSSGDFDNIFFHHEIIRRKYPVILSSGMSDFSEIKKVIDLYISKRHKMITLLHCVSVYPAEIKKLNLNFISTLKKLYPDLIIGFSDHTNEILTGALSCSAGAKVIEKHITFSNNFLGPDHKASLTISNFKKYTKMIRLAQISLGKEIKSIYNDELEIKKIARKSLAYSKDLKKGNRISKGSMHALRPGNGISTFEYKNLIGKILKKDVKKNTLLRGSDFLNG